MSSVFKEDSARMTVDRNVGRILVGGLIVSVSLASASAADVWGVKSRDPDSNPPATLFRIVETGGFATVGPVTRGGANIDVDGLAITASEVLYGFEVFDGSASQLLRINTTTAVATPIGPPLTERDIRGAVMDRAGRLLVLDARNDELLEIDEFTAAVVATPVPLTLDGNAYALSDITDIVQRADGTFIVVDLRSFYTLSTATGILNLVHIDATAGTDGALPGVAGLATSVDASVSGTLFAYDVLFQDDIFTYDSAGGFARSLLHANIISGYNAGRGDLAAAPAAAIVPALSPGGCIVLAAILVAAMASTRRRKGVAIGRHAV